MGRDANFSELREAIRQGQAKIAQGLKTGQMRSDRDKGSRVPVPRLDPAHEVLGKKPTKPTLTEKIALFEPRKKVRFRFSLPKLPKIRIRLPRLPRVSLPPMRPMLFGVAAIVAVAMVVLVVFWVGKSLFGSGSARPPVANVDAGVRQPAVGTTPVESRPVAQALPVPVTSVQRETVQPPAEPVRQAPAPTLPRTGDNVIVIQSITSSRENELKPVQEFFGRNGIPTDVLRRSNYSLLVTRQMFDNPDKPGTTGYEMKKKITLIGKNYPVQTGDAKFGNEPFQDAYGMVIR